MASPQELISVSPGAGQPAAMVDALNTRMSEASLASLNGAIKEPQSEPIIHHQQPHHNQLQPQHNQPQSQHNQPQSQHNQPQSQHNQPQHSQPQSQHSQPQSQPTSPKKSQRKCFKKSSVKSSVFPTSDSELAHSSQTSSTTPSSRNKSRAEPVATKPSKEKLLTYVNYLNAFSNSLTVHPPKRAARPAVGSSRDSDGCGMAEVDFDVGGKSGSTVPYLPDFDRDRCSHSGSFCPFSKREGYLFCEKHLLDDKALPFVPCAFQRTESNPCPYPARMPPGAGGKNRPQRSKEALCALHIEKCMQEVHLDMGSSANAILSTMDGLDNFNINPDKGLPPTTPSELLNDLAEIQTRENLETYLRAAAKDTYATESSSDNSCVDEGDLGLFTSRTFDTDDEVVDSEDDDVTRHAHTFSVEELIRILRLKMAKQKELLSFEIKLQEYKLKDARAHYLEDVALEKTFMPSVSQQSRLDPHALKPYRHLRTMLRFHHRRPRFSFAHSKKPGVWVKTTHMKFPENVSRCHHAEAGIEGLPANKQIKCRQFSLPFSRHCLLHILEDEFQYLYKRCAAEVPKQCQNPVLRNMGINFCFHHVDLNMTTPTAPNLDDSQTQNSSSSEDDAEWIEASPINSLPTAPSVPLLTTPSVPLLTTPLPENNSPRPKRQYIKRKPASERVRNVRAKKMNKQAVEIKVEKNDSPEIGVIPH